MRELGSAASRSKRARHKLPRAMIGLWLWTFGGLVSTLSASVARADLLPAAQGSFAQEPQAFQQTFIDYIELYEPLLLSKNEPFSDDWLAALGQSSKGEAFIEATLQDFSAQRESAKVPLLPQREGASSKGQAQVPSRADQTIFADVELAELVASRSRFREFLREDQAPIAQLDERFLGSLMVSDATLSEPELSEMIAMESRSSSGFANEFAGVPGEVLAAGESRYQHLHTQGAGSGVRLESDKTYTVQNGRIVEVAADQDESSVFEETMAPLQVYTDDSGKVIPGTVVEHASEQDAEGTAVLVTEKAAGNDAGVVQTEGFLPKSSATVLADSMLSEDASSVNSATGQIVRGRVSVPKGFDARNVILRVAGTAVQTYPDQDGFFELGPFSLGSSFELLVFDVDSRLNRRIIPFFISERMREREIKLMASKDIATLAKSFGSFQLTTRSGFCGTVLIDPQQLSGSSNSGVTTRLVDSLGRSRDLHFYSEQGLPSLERQLSRDGRVCSFNLEKGVYKLYVIAGDLRRSFFLHLHDSTFENSVRFDMAATTYVKTAALSLVDEEVALEMATESGMQPVIMSRPLQNFWLTNQGRAIWAPVTDHMLTTDSAYAPQQVVTVGSKNYFSLGDDIIEMRESDSGSFELIGSDLVQELGSQGKLLTHHLLSEDLIRDLKNLSADPSQSDTFLLFGDIDTSKFVADSSGAISRIVVTDIWTGNKVAGVTLLGTPGDRILRFMVAGLETGVYNFSIYGKGNRLLWSSIVRALPSSTQVISNRSH